MPPEDRFVPRFAAEPPQDLLPYGRWSQTLTEEFLAACLRIDSAGDDLGEPGEVTWYPDRTWHGRTFVPGTALTSAGYELYGYVSYAPGEIAEPLYDRFAERLGAARGVFGAMMEVELVNDGPVTLLVELA